MLVGYGSCVMKYNNFSPNVGGAIGISLTIAWTKEIGVLLAFRFCISFDMTCVIFQQTYTHFRLHSMVLSKPEHAYAKSHFPKVAYKTSLTSRFNLYKINFVSHTTTLCVALHDTILYHMKRGILKFGSLIKSKNNNDSKILNKL